MDLYNLIMKIPYVLMLFTGFTIISMLYVGGLQSISVDIDTYNKERFRAAVVLENTISVSEEPQELDYSYEHRRSAIPAEFFIQEVSNEDQIGYMKNGGDCYIPRVPGLNGRDFAFNIQLLDNSVDHDLECIGNPSGKTAVYSPIMVIRDGLNKDRVPARLIVYAK